MIGYTMFPGYTDFCACATMLSAREDDPWCDSQPAMLDYSVAEYGWQDGLEKMHAAMTQAFRSSPV